ncbi:MAG: carbohydrate kinase family protein [Planctomycetes bacterium]|nr:carbohydrate kinase family protein [Planctomycetota bacterium]
MMTICSARPAPQSEATCVPSESATPTTTDSIAADTSPGPATDFVGPATLDIAARPVTLPGALPVGDTDKVDVVTDMAPGGGAVNMAQAYRLAGGTDYRLGVITGPDHAGRLLMALVAAILTNVRQFCTAVRTRLSLLTPLDDQARVTRTWTERCTIDTAETWAQVEGWLRKGRRLVLASMTAEQTDLVEQIIAAHNGPVAMRLTRSQCADRERTLALAAGCDLVQLNASELETLSGITGDLVAGINVLRDHSIHSVIVTAGRRGIYAYFDWAGGWHYVPAFAVGVVSSPSKCGDTVLGTFFAGLDRGVAARASLRIAAAAAAMNAAGLPHRGGWDELAGFAQQTAMVPFAPTPVSRRRVNRQQITPTARRWLVPAGYLTGGAALVLMALRIVQFMA